MQGHTDPPTPKILEEAPAANLVQAPPGSRLTRFWRTLVKPFRPYEEPSTPKVAEHVPLVPLPSLAAAAQNESKETEPEAYTSEENEAACANMWSVYIREAERYDKGLVESWKGDMDGILIFSGLFSAALTAFLIESYQTLQSDSGDRTVELLMHISQQLASPSTLAAASPDPSPPTIAALFCNILWFTSLALSLTCSLLATLVQQWARDFLHKTEMRPAPVIRARVFSFLYFGLQKFQMGAVVDAIPLVLHVSLFLFFAGLIAFLLPVNRILMYLMGAVLVLFIGLYMYFTVLPILSFDSPYHTPLSKFSWSIRQWYSNLTKPQAQLSTVSLAEAIVNHSTVSVDREVCDDRAVQWTVKSLTDDAELLPFVEAISDVICGPKGLRSQNEHMLSQILDITDAHTSIISRITNLLQSSSNPWVDEKLRIRRQNACCKALWSLAWMLCESSQKAKPPSNGGIFWFDIGTAELLKSIRDVNGYAHSAWALVRYNRLKTLKDAVMEALRGCGMDSDTPEMKALRVRDIFSGSSDEDLRGIGYRGASDLFTTLTRVRQPLQDETEALSLIEKLSTEFNWTMMQDDILLDYLCASFRARLCPHQLSQTVKAILSVESPTVSGDERWFLRHVFYNIPDPSEEESLQKADVHDVDKLVMTSLDLLPHVPHNDWAFWLSRYIASRNSDVVVQQILAHCDMTGFAAASVEFHQDRSVPLTIGIYCRLRNDSLYPPIFPGQYEFANAVFPLLEPGNPDDLAALTSVKCLLLDQLRDKIFWGPPLSLEELDDVNRHPLLCADFAPIHLPAEESLTTEENVRATLRKRLEQISISILADFISISATLPAYYATQTAKTICDWDLRSFVGSIPVEKQRKFAKHTHSLAENLSKNPKTPGLEDVLGIVWKASREWLWIDDAEATEGLQSAISLYCHNDTLKAERHERRSLTRPLSERIETVLTQPDHPPSLPAASGHSEEAQTLSNASYDPADLGTSASARQPELTSENLAEDAYPDPPGSIPSLESTTANVPDLSDGAGI